MKPASTLSRRIYVCLPALLAALVCACKDEAISSDHTPNDITGSWRTRGYGWHIQVDENRVTLYDTTRTSCIESPSLSGPHADGLVDAELATYQLSRSGEDLLISDDLTLHVEAARVAGLPDPCKNDATPPSQDPLLAFDVLWQTFEENYAFFELHGVDWHVLGAEQRQRLSAGSTPEELFEVLAELLGPLNDGHVSVSAGENSFRSGERPPWVEQYGEEFSQRLQHGYLAGEGISVDVDGLMAHRTLNDGVGYLALGAMAGYAERGEADAAGAALDAALADLGAISGLVLDMRMNIGGHDGVALSLAGRFADERRLAFTKQAREGSGFTSERSHYVEPTGAARFVAPTVVLTGKLTASAAETFVMAMRELPHVTIVGEPTTGIFSDQLFKTLPNGWFFTLSNERYRAADGAIYEGIGLPPDELVPFDAQEFVAGLDDELEAAVARLEH